MSRIILVVMLVVSALAGRITTSAQTVSCADFDAFEWAQSVYETDPARYAALDLDGDGVACPELGPGAAPALWTSSVPSNAEPARLSRVVDGDTADFVLSDGTIDRVRFLLIDTPETVDPSRPVGCFGQEASDFTTWLLSFGGEIYLERDVSERDQYDRLLRYVWLDLGGGEVYLVNEALARSGYATLSTFPPDVKYVEQIQAGQAFAERHQRGLWGACPSFDAPLPAQSSDSQPAQPSGQVAVAPGGSGCDPSYPTLCLPPSPDLNCGDIPDRLFPVLPPDPHAFDGDHDGMGVVSPVHQAAAVLPRHLGLIRVVAGSARLRRIVRLPPHDLYYASIARRSKKSGKVFATQPGSRSRTPGARSAVIAKLIAIRWSS